MKKLYAMMGSHRRKGYTDMALRFLLEKLSSRFEIQRDNVIEKKITYCMGCEKCKETGKCVYDDDMTQIYEKIRNADIIIIASPVYFSSYPAAMKTILDRGQLFYNNPLIDKQRKVYTLSIGGAPGYDNQFRALDLTLEYFLKNINASLAGHCNFSDSDSFGKMLPENIQQRIVLFSNSIQ